jgi:branched-chain amino acid transport system substrate-binding protein
MIMKKVVIFGLICGIFLLGGMPNTTYAEQKTLKIGSLVPLSGAAAPWGWDVVNGMKLIVEETNAAGGLKIGNDNYKIEYIYYDTKARADEATTLAKKLIFGDKVKYIIGAQVGATCDAIQLVSEPNKVWFSFGCWGIKNLGVEKPFSFRMPPGPLELNPVMYEFIKKKNPNIKSVAIINPNDTSGWDCSKGAKLGANKVGYQVVADIYYERGTADFGSFVSKVLAAKPDLIDLAGSPPGDAGLITKLLHERGYKGAKAYGAAMNSEPYIRVAGEAAEGTFIGVGWDLEGDFVRPSVKELAKKFRAKFKDPIGANGLAEYAAAQMVFAAMQKTGSIEVETIVEYITTNKNETVLGPIVIGGKEDYGINRQFLVPMVASIVKGGKVVNQEETLPFQLR